MTTHAMSSIPNRASDGGPDDQESPEPDFVDLCFYAEDAIKHCRRAGKSDREARKALLLDALSHLHSALQVL